MAGFWGKHSGHDGFISAGLEENAYDAVIPWLNSCLADLRDALGQGWPDAFDAMPVLGFWIGPGVSGAGPIAGVMAPSRDKAGARYPLLVLGRGEIVPPMLVPGDFHPAAAAALTELKDAAAVDLADWPLDLGEADNTAPFVEDPSLVWASDPSMTGSELLAEIAQYDHAASCNNRVHFWSLSPAGQGVVLSCAHMPDADAFAWLLKAGGVEGQEVADTADSEVDSALAPLRLGRDSRVTGADLDPNTKERLVLMPEWQSGKEAFWRIKMAEENGSSESRRDQKR